MAEIEIKDTGFALRHKRKIHPMAKRVNISRLPPHLKKTTSETRQPEPSENRYNTVDHLLIGIYVDKEGRKYNVIRSYCKHKDGIDEWLEWRPDTRPFKNRVFMPLKEDVLRKRIEAGELTKIG